MNGSADAGDFDVVEAYAAKTPAENRELYRKWADTYESGFITSRGYVYHERVAELFVERLGDQPLGGPTLDVGCGTGIVGEALAKLGVGAIEGIDISPDMIGHAASKTRADGSAVYAGFTEADLTKTVDLADATYAGVISVGTFTIGHVGPEALSELFRVGRPGAHYAFGINREHFVDRGFEARLDQAVSDGTITPYELAEIRMYENDVDDYSTDTAYVARFAKST